MDVYDKKSDLPKGVKDSLPSHAQEIYLSAYNSAAEQHKGEDGVKSTSHKIAWAAVKQVYGKSENGWHRLDKK